LLGNVDTKKAIRRAFLIAFNLLLKIGKFILVAGTGFEPVTFGL